MISSKSSSFHQFDGPLLTHFLIYLTPREWASFAQCASWCNSLVNDADVLWKFAAETLFQLDMKAIQLQSNWKSFIVRNFSHYPPKMDHFFASTSSLATAAATTTTTQKSNSTQIGKWRTICAPVADSQQQQNSSLLNMKTLLDQDLSAIVERNALTSMKSRFCPASTKIVSFTVTVSNWKLFRERKSKLFQPVDDHIKKVLGVDREKSTIGFDFTETSSSSSSSPLCQLFILDMFPITTVSVSSSTPTSNVFLLFVVNDEVTRKTLLQDHHQDDDEEEEAAAINANRAQLVDRRATAVDSLQTMMELLYSTSSSVVIILPQQQQQPGQRLRSCSYLEAMLHVSAADQCVPEWTVSNHFPTTLFLFPTSNNNNNTNDDDSSTTTTTTEIISDKEWKDFVRDRLHINSPSASSVSLFFATRSREAFFGSDLNDLLSMSAKFTMSTTLVAERNFYISWNIAPGLLTYGKNQTSLGNGGFFDIGFSPSLHEYLLFLTSALFHSTNPSSSSSSANNNNENNNSSHSSNNWWSPSLRHMKEDDGSGMAALSAAAAAHQENGVIPLTFSNLNKMNDDNNNDGAGGYYYGNNGRGNQAVVDHVELIPDPEAHRALLAMSDASETASSYGTRDITTTGTEDDGLNNNNNNDTTEDTNNNNVATTAEEEQILAAFQIMALEDDDEEVLEQINRRRQELGTTISPQVLPTIQQLQQQRQQHFQTTTTNPDEVHSNRSQTNSSSAIPPATEITPGFPNAVATASPIGNLERVHGKCSALPLESPQSALLPPPHVSEFWFAYSRHARSAFEVALELCRPYCTTRHFSLLVADAIRSQIDEVTRKLWSSYGEHSEMYCTELANTIFKHFRANYGNPTVFEYRREKNALKKWFAASHEKIEEYLLKSRGPKRLQVLSRFISEILVPEFVEACEADLNRHKQELLLLTKSSNNNSNNNISESHNNVENNDDDSTATESNFDSESENNKNGHNSQNKKHLFKMIHPGDARQAGSCLIREVDGMVFRCGDTTLMANDPQRLEFMKTAKNIALRFADETEANVNEYIMEAATESSIFDRRLTQRLHAIISPTTSGLASDDNQNQQPVRTTTTTNLVAAAAAAPNNNNNPQPQPQNRNFLRSAVNFFSNMLQSNNNNN